MRPAPAAASLRRPPPNVGHSPDVGCLSASRSGPLPAAWPRGNAQGAINVAGAHGYVRGSEIDRLYRDLTGGIVMAWKTDELRHSLGLSALGQETTIASAPRGRRPLPFAIGGERR